MTDWAVVSGECRDDISGSQCQCSEVGQWWGRPSEDLRDCCRSTTVSHRVTDTWCCPWA